MLLASSHELRSLLNDFTFRYQRRAGNSLLIKWDGTVAWQQNYLYDIARYRIEDRKIYYFDETWVDAEHRI